MTRYKILPQPIGNVNKKQGLIGNVNESITLHHVVGAAIWQNQLAYYDFVCLRSIRMVTLNF